MGNIELQLKAHGVSSVWVLLADVQAGIVSTQNSHALHHLATELESAGATVGVSPPRNDFSQAAPALRLARTAMLASPHGTVTFFKQSPLGVLAAAAPDVADQVSQDVLDGALQLNETDRALLIETVLAWFDAGGSVRHTAEKLYLHPNTVRNRLKRFETLTAHTLTNPRAAAEVLLALHAYQQR